MSALASERRTTKVCPAGPLRRRHGDGRRPHAAVQAARAQGPEKAVTGHAPSSACAPGPYAHLPGDPGVILYTNVTMGDKKMAFMKAVSQAVASCLGKPESYVGVCVQDGQDMIFGGSDAPCALAMLTSLGAINKANNEAFSAALAQLLAEHGVESGRYYVNFFDVPRENCGYKGATFA